ALERTQAKGCWAVVLEAETGNVLAMAGAPVFDPVKRTSTDGSPFSNAVVREPYEPGSIQKTVTVAAAIEEGIVDVGTVFGAVADRIELHPGACKSDTDDIYGCYADFDEHEARALSVRDVFTVSSNVGIIRVARRMPADLLETYIERFGLTPPTGIDYTGESGGLLNMAAGCSACPLSAAIGYSLAVSPLQMAAAYGAIANDGVWTQPRLAASSIDVDGNETANEQETQQAVPPETARIMGE